MPIAILLFAVLSLAACQQQDYGKEVHAADPVAASAAPAGEIQGTILETFDSGGYTYVHVDTGTQKVWAAGPPTTLKQGDTITFSTGMPMENFHSKSLSRDFAVLYFVGSFGADATPDRSHAETAMPISPHGNNMSEVPSAPVGKMARVENGYTIDELYRQKASLAGQRVRVRGQVTRVTSNVMKMNWIHIQDGSRPEDLTITTTENAGVGDIIIVEGKLAADKKTGFGRVYEVILEDSRLSAEPSQ